MYGGRSTTRRTGSIAKYFFDTSVLVRALLEPQSHAATILFGRDPLVQRYTGWIALKELRRLPRDHPKLGLRLPLLERHIDRILEHLILVPALPLESFRDITLGDRSDRPIVAAARHVHAILVTRDRALAIDARPYVETLLIED